MKLYNYKNYSYFYNKRLSEDGMTWIISHEMWRENTFVIVFPVYDYPFPMGEEKFQHSVDNWLEQLDHYKAGFVFYNDDGEIF